MRFSRRVGRRRVSPRHLQASQAVHHAIAHRRCLRAIGRLTLADPKERLLLKTLAAGISIYSPHTALDSCENGVNDWLARAAKGADAKATIAAITPLKVPLPGTHD